MKPSNVLINTQGQVKMCDFGISGYLVDSVAKTMDAGCKPYMAVTNRFNRGAELMSCTAARQTPGGSRRISFSLETSSFYSQGQLRLMEEEHASVLASRD